MAHCGFEGTAVNDAFSKPLKALKAALMGPRVSGPMAHEVPLDYREAVNYPAVASITAGEIQRISRI
jgi:hypothetical protein